MASGEDDDRPQPRTYRAKLLDTSGRIVTTMPIMAGDDLEALKQVRGLSETYTVELWEGGRRVTTVQKRE